MCKIKCNARDNKADIKNNTHHFDISGMSTKPTQNQVFKPKSQKTNSESSVFKPKSASHPRDKKADIKNNNPAADTLAK